MCGTKYRHLHRVPLLLRSTASRCRKEDSQTSIGHAGTCFALCKSIDAKLANVTSRSGFLKENFQVVLVGQDI